MEASGFMEKEITLDVAAEQQEMRITGMTGSHAQKTRMLQMGFTPGTRVRIIRRAPMADPVEIKVRGTRMLLRRDECQNIKVAAAE
jgi:ferrous iron transport protein A